LVDAFKKLLLWLLSWAFDGFNDSIDSAIDVLGGTDFDIMSQASSLSNVFSPVCSSIVAICALTELAIYASHVDSLRWEHGIKIGAKLSMAKAFYSNAPALLLAIYAQCQSWIGLMTFSDVEKATSRSISSKIIGNFDKIMDGVSGLGNTLGLFLTLIIVILAIKACGLLILVMAYGRIFEILAYAIISPIPCAFLPLTGTTEFGINNITKKFFKSFIAVCLQGLIMVVCLRVYNLIMCGALDTVIDNMGSIDDYLAAGGNAVAYVSDMLWTMALGSVALVVAVSKSSSWAKSMIDG